MSKAIGGGITRGRKLALHDDGTITYRGQTYPVAGAHAEMSDDRGGLFGRRHTVGITVTLASGEQLFWHRTSAGTQVKLDQIKVRDLSARINTASAQQVLAS